MLTLYISEPRTITIDGWKAHGGAYINSSTALKWKLQTTARVDVTGATGSFTYVASSEGDYTATVLLSSVSVTHGRRYLLVTYEDVAAASRRHYREIEVLVKERGAD